MTTTTDTEIRQALRTLGVAVFTWEMRNETLNCLCGRGNKERERTGEVPKSLSRNILRWMRLTSNASEKMQAAFLTIATIAKRLVKPAQARVLKKRVHAMLSHVTLPSSRRRRR